MNPSNVETHFHTFAQNAKQKFKMTKIFYATLLLLAMSEPIRPQSTQPKTAPLPTDRWQFRQAGTAEWLPVELPMSAHSALEKHGKIDDPFWRDNEAKYQWIENEDFEFETVFDAPAEVFQKRHIELVFKSLDTYAQVFLNDSLILETDNQFRTWRADVKKWLRPTGNRLHIYFESAVKKTEQDWKNLGYELPGGQRVMSRKAQFHFGWDWGPRFVSCGIYKTPELLGWDDFILEDVHVVPTEVSPELAKLAIRVRYRSDAAAEVEFVNKFSKRKTIEGRTLEIGVREDSMTFEIPNPELWYCNGMGSPKMYDFVFEVVKNGRPLDRREIRTGIRKIELITEKDADGESFYFKLNGRRVFAKGANYIPAHIFQDKVSGKDYARLLDATREGNMNMLRVWGGGIYEDDLFYQLCDERGILVWQDFMYACAMYPGSGSFLKNASREAVEQIERLRRHPCIALFCGNNENNEAWHHWGWQMLFNEEQRTRLWRDYLTLFKDLLPNLVANDGAGIPYWESSPKYGRGNPKSNSEGDSHYWGVWHDAEPFSTYEKKVPRFMSEYGFQSFPDWRTIESFTEPADRELETKVMLAHQKHPRGNALIAEYMGRDYRKPKSFKDFVYVSQLLQAEGMRRGIEAHRRRKPYCMGTLYWQLNDVWPVASWSGIDNFGRWKALHYFARESFEPVAALPMLDDDILKVVGVNDRIPFVKGKLDVRLLDFDGSVISAETLPEVKLHPDSSRMLWQASVKTFLKKKKPEDVVLEVVLSAPDGSEIFSRRLFYLLPPRDLKLPRPTLKMSVAQVNDGYEITVESDKLAKNIYLNTAADGFFSDNFFDLLAGEKRKVLFKTQRILDSPESVFELRSLTDTF